MADANMLFMMESPLSGPRIFSADLSSSDSEGDYICINPKNLLPGKQEQDKSSSKPETLSFYRILKQCSPPTSCSPKESFFLSGTSSIQRSFKTLH
ncbi:hypothetical protein Bca52824_004867 [Brassica carinata]|uniref:Uncharacterized protein n=1 Tax=Brassica carinata TaxID=52824 RepID=A0A8X8BH36_BRACI|nr:hypothetical protein Bca52824_004867 [Brassica carinata]